MLPEVLSADVCSLKAGEDRAALACHLQVTKAGALKSWRFTRAVVRLAANIAYEDAQKAVDSGNPPEYLANLWAAWKALAAARGGDGVAVTSTEVFCCGMMASVAADLVPAS